MADRPKQDPGRREGEVEIKLPTSVFNNLVQGVTKGLKIWEKGLETNGVLISDFESGREGQSHITEGITYSVWTLICL